MRIVSLLLVSSFAATALSASPALAETDGKTLPGAACLASEDGVTKIVRDGRQHAFNSAEQRATWYCPVIKDNGLGIIRKANVFVSDKSVTDLVRCALESRNSNGTLVAVSRRTTGGGAQGENDTFVQDVELTFDTVVQGTNPGYYALVCDVPGKTSVGKSGLFMYDVLED